MLDTGNPVQN